MGDYVVLQNYRGGGYNDSELFGIFKDTTIEKIMPYFCSHLEYHIYNIDNFPMPERILNDKAKRKVKIQLYYDDLDLSTQETKDKFLDASLIIKQCSTTGAEIEFSDLAQTAREKLSKQEYEAIVKKVKAGEL